MISIYLAVYKEETGEARAISYKEKSSAHNSRNTTDEEKKREAAKNCSRVIIESFYGLSQLSQFYELYQVYGSLKPGIRPPVGISKGGTIQLSSIARRFECDSPTTQRKTHTNRYSHTKCMRA